MSVISKIETGCYRVPLPVVLSDSTHGDLTHFELILVQIEDADGSKGVGYTYTVGSGGEAARVLVEHYLKPLLLGQDPSLIEKLWERMWWGLHYGGRGGTVSLAISAVDIALWDLASCKVSMPLWKFLGGYDPIVPCYAGGIDLQFTEEQLLKQADGFLEQGFRAIKMKIGRKHLSEDLKRVKAMRRHLGSDFPLMADANMGWSVDQAIRACRALAEFELVWIEEPCIPDDVAGHARIVREGGQPIATGENLHSLYEFQQMITAGGVTFPEPDVSNCGGITVFMKIAHLAESFNLPVTSHGVHDLTVQLLAALPNRSYLEIHGFGLDRYIREPVQLCDGNAIAPDRPGHGVDFNLEKLAELSV